MLGVEALGMDGGADELLHEGLDDLITREFYIEHRTTLVDAIHGEAAATLVGVLLEWADMIYQTALKLAAENGILMIGKHAHAFIF